MNDGANPSTSQPDIEVQLEEMWAGSVRQIAAINPLKENWKIQTLPLARVKKIMKSEDYVLQELEKEKLIQQGKEVEDDKPASSFMISGEAPVLMSKACELLIKELTLRAWRHTECNRRRTLQRADIHAAVGGSEVFDFLIDIVPRVSTASASRTAQPMDDPASVPQQLTAMQSLPAVNDSATSDLQALNGHAGAELPMQLSVDQGSQVNYFFNQMGGSAEAHDGNVLQRNSHTGQQSQQDQQSWGDRA